MVKNDTLKYADWPQNAGSPISEELGFNIFRGTMSPHPQQNTAFGGPHLKNLISAPDIFKL